MSTICRTCLQTSNRTYKTHQLLEDFGGEEVKISIVLRFCMPELYLGLSTNPEICHECKESLKVVYRFKKKCLNTENVIGNFLKNARCTAKSVDLHDVLAYFDEQAKLQLDVNKACAEVMSSAIAKDIISEWDEAPDDAVNNENIISEVRQSAPNPANFQYHKNKLKFCHETGLFFDQQGQYFDCSGYPVDKNDVIKNTNETQVTNTNNPDFVQCTGSSDNLCTITSVFSLSECTDIVDKDPVNAADDTNSASNVNNANDDEVNIKEEPLDIETNGNLSYSQSDEDTLDASETASYEDVQSTSNLQGIIDNLPEINDTNQYVDIPEFVHINNFGLKELEELRRQQQKDGKTADENTVSKVSNVSGNLKPSSETGDVSEKDLIAKEFTKVSLSSLPETLFINGKKMVKCTEGYRITELPTMGPVKILGPLKKIVKRADNATQEKSLKTKKLYSIIPEEYFKKHFTKLDDVKKIPTKLKPAYCSQEIPEPINKRHITENPHVPNTGIVQDSQNQLVSAFSNVDSGSNKDLGKDIPGQIIHKPACPESKLNKFKKNKKPVDSVPKAVGNQACKPVQCAVPGPVGRKRRKIKIVPVAEKKLPLYSMKGSKLYRKLTEPSKYKKIKLIPKVEDKDVVVLFTNYTYDGEYINDHDYLVNPYKRNKILFEEDNEWFCMCYICNCKHHVYDHVPHMKTHQSKCKICMVDLGTPYMLNVHVKAHSKLCRQCTERVSYGQIESHEEQHLRDELEYERATTKKSHHLGKSRRRRRVKKEVAASIEPVSLPTKELELETKEDDEEKPQELEKISSIADLKLEEESSDEEWRKSGTSSKKPKWKKRKLSKSDIESALVERSSRVLRSNARKSYSETESEEKFRDLKSSNSF